VIHLTDENETLEGIQVHDNVSNPKSPLVIDLPDGQKLLVGELPAGSVVEIATWRGTGRPDSRTTRLLLGVTNDEKTDSVTTVNETGTTHIDVRSRSERRKNQKSNFRIKLNRLVIPALLIAGLIFAFNASPLSLVHPTVGSSAGFGSADSSLVVAGPISTVKKDQLIVANFGDAGDQVILGRVNSVAGKDVLLQTDAGFAQVNTDSVIGKVLIVIPFLGKLFK
jgi:hypothetical protein